MPFTEWDVPNTEHSQSITIIYASSASPNSFSILITGIKSTRVIVMITTIIYHYLVEFILCTVGKSIWTTCCDWHFHDTFSAIFDKKDLFRFLFISFINTICFCHSVMSYCTVNCLNVRCTRTSYKRVSRVDFQVYNSIARTFFSIYENKQWRCVIFFFKTSHCPYNSISSSTPILGLSVHLYMQYREILRGPSAD